MKKLPISSRGWVFVLLTGLILMFGALHTWNSRDSQDVPATAQGSGGSGDEVPLNTLNDDAPPPMPSTTGGSPDGGTGQSSGSSGGTFSSSDGGGALSVTGGPSPQQPQSSGSGGQPVAQDSSQPQPVVWVSEEDASAYSQPGFNMPVVRPLKKWEELKIVESTKENWDRVRDTEGQEFWVQKKVVTIIRPQNLNQPSVAEEKVMDFYTAVAQQRHSDAYIHLSPEWKRELSYDRFVRGYSHVDSLRSEIVNVFELGEDRFQVDVAQEAIENGAPVDYLGIYTVERLADDKWYLTSGSLKRQARQF